MIWKVESPNVNGRQKARWKNESNIRDLGDNVKHTNLHIIGGSQKGKKDQRGLKMYRRNYGYKLPKPKEENRYPSTGST